MEIFARSPKTCIFWKRFFKNRPKSSPRFKGPKARWRKWHYPLISMLLKFKDWKKFWRKRRLKMYPNGQVMAIFARSPKNRIFWKSAKGGPREIFQKSFKKESSFNLKGPKALSRKWHYPLISMHLNCKNWRRFWRKQPLQKCPNGQVMEIFAKSPKTCISEKGFSKTAQKVALVWKAQKHSGANGIIL